MPYAMLCIGRIMTVMILMKKVMVNWSAHDHHNPYPETLLTGQKFKKKKMLWDYTLVCFHE